MSTGPFEGKAIPDPGFAGDQGSAPAELVAALDAFSSGSGSPWSVLRALATNRVLVPVVAILEEAGTDERGLTHDKQSAMATVLLDGPNGERSMLAFTSIAALAAWRPDARPVPIGGIDAARSAVAEGAQALLVDAAGPVPFAITGDELTTLAEARLVQGRLVDDPDVRSAIAGIVESEPAVIKAVVEPSSASPTRGTRLVLALDPMLPPDAYRALLDRVTSQLHTNTALRTLFPEGLSLQIVSAGANLDDTPGVIPPPETVLREDSSHGQETHR